MVHAGCFARCVQTKGGIPRDLTFEHPSPRDDVFDALRINTSCALQKRHGAVQPAFRSSIFLSWGGSSSLPLAMPEEAANDTTISKVSAHQATGRIFALAGVQVALEEEVRVWQHDDCIRAAHVCSAPMFAQCTVTALQRWCAITLPDKSMTTALLRHAISIL